MFCTEEVRKWIVNTNNTVKSWIAVQSVALVLVFLCSLLNFCLYQFQRREVMSAVASTNPEEAGQEGSDTDAAGASSSTNTKPGQSQPEIVYSETGASSGGAGDATNPSVPRTLPSLPVMIQAPPFATGTNNPIPHNGQQQTSFLQSLRQQNPEPKIFNEWTIRPPFSTFSETPGLIGYQGVPVTVRNSSPTTCPNSFILGC